jgi:signal peptidase I
MSATRVSVRNSLADASLALRLPSTRGVRWRDIGWSILPGLGHIRRGQRALGRLILAAWSLCLLLAALGAGSAISLLFCFVAVSIHSLAISLLLSEMIQQMPLLRRMVFGLGLYWVIFVCLYYPAHLVTRSCVRVLAVEGVRTFPGIDNGDVLLYSGEWTRPSQWQRGDVVVFQIPASTMPGAYIRDGVGVDRIVGLPGDHVVLKGGTIFVNDVPLPRELYPLGDVTKIADVNLTALDDEYIVLPTVLRWTTQGNAANFLNQLVGRVSVVPESSISGKVVWRLRPWSRAGSILEHK